MFKVNLIILLFAFSLFSCGNKTENRSLSNENKNNEISKTQNQSSDDKKLTKEDNDNTTAVNKTQTKQITEIFKSELTSVFKSYLAVSSSLVTSSTEDTKSSAGNLKVVLKKVESDGLDDVSKARWNGYLSKMTSLSNQMEKSEDIGTQRKLFYDLSETLAKAIKRFGIKEKSVYRIYCPMAFDEKGAYWLNDSKDVINPYFGDEMLHCGEVKEQLANAENK